jgi:hypothetical protein
LVSTCFKSATANSDAVEINPEAVEDNLDFAGDNFKLAGVIWNYPDKFSIRVVPHSIEARSKCRAHSFHP